MPSARLSLPLTGALSLLMAGLLSGCAAGAPVTITPARPPHPVTAPDDVATTGPAHGGDALDREEDREQAGPGSEETRLGRGAKQPVSTDELVVLGEELTAALESGDVEQWLALTTLTGEAAQQQRDWFAGVQAVPMDVREMHPTWLLERDVDGEVHGPLVEFSFRHQVTGADVQPVVELYEFTLERVGTDGPYRVVGVSGSDAADSAYPQLWDVGPIEVVETEHTVLVAEAGSGVAELSGALDEAAAAALEAFPVEGVGRMAVTVVDEPLLSTVFDDSKEEGFYAGFAYPVPASPQVLERSGLPEVVAGDDIGARLVVSLEFAEDEWRGYGEPDGGSPVGRHEALHLVMMLRYPDDLPPRWMSEGFAGWFELAGDPDVLESHETWYRVLSDPDDLPDSLRPSGSEDFFSGPFDDPDTSDLAYFEAANVFLAVEATHGAEATMALGEALHSYDVWADDEEVLDELIRGALGTDLAGLEGLYVEWVRDTYGG